MLVSSFTDALVSLPLIFADSTPFEFATGDTTRIHSPNVHVSQAILLQSSIPSRYWKKCSITGDHSY